MGEKTKHLCFFFQPDWGPDPAAGAARWAVCRHSGGDGSAWEAAAGRKRPCQLQPRREPAVEAGGSSSWQGGAVFCPDSYRPAQRVSLWHVPVFPALRRVAVGRFAKAPLFYSSLIFGAAWLTASFHPWRWRLLGRRSSPRSRSAQTPASLCSSEPFRKGKHFFSPLFLLCLFGLGRWQSPLSSRVGPKGGVRSRQPRWLQRSPALSAAPGPREPRGRGAQRRAHRNKPHRSDKSSVWCT